MRRSFRISSWAVLEPGVPPDVSFVPPLVRRRLSPLQKIFFSLAKSVGAESPAQVVFSSRDGEDTLTRRIVDEFNADGSVSPNRFSSSVYNAAPGLWSVTTGNREPYTAVAAGDDSIECGLLEALSGEECSVFAYAEETGGGYGAAFKAEATGAEGREVVAQEGDPSRPPIGFGALVDFLAGKVPSLEGRWIALRYT